MSRRRKTDPRILWLPGLEDDPVLSAAPTPAIVKSPPSPAHADLVPLIVRRFDPDELPRGPAVYAIENLADGKLYVGSSRDASRRVRSHLYDLRHKKHGNPYLQHAFDKHGKKQFRAFPLQVLDDECSARDLLRAEHEWIAVFLTSDPANGYNIQPIPLRDEDADPLPAAAMARLRKLGRPPPRCRYHRHSGLAQRK